MTGQSEMIAHVMAVSSGTASRLCGSARYDDIDAYMTGWLEWLQSPDQRGKSWVSWIECHQEYADETAQAQEGSQ